MLHYILEKELINTAYIKYTSNNIIIIICSRATYWSYDWRYCGYCYCRSVAVRTARLRRAAFGHTRHRHALPRHRGAAHTAHRTHLALAPRPRARECASAPRPVQLPRAQTCGRVWPGCSAVGWSCARAQMSYRKTPWSERSVCASKLVSAGRECARSAGPNSAASAS